MSVRFVPGRLAKVVVLLVGLLPGAWQSARTFAADGDVDPNKQPLHVPADHPTIQGAIDAVGDGGTVVIAPGTYRESLTISGKALTLCSEFHLSGDRRRIAETIVSGSIPEDENNEGRREFILEVADDAGPATQICGLTFRGGDDGIVCYAPIAIRHNRFEHNMDAIDYEGGGGVCEFNHFERNEDDAVDVDGACSVIVQHNRIVDNLDDGVEIRLHPYEGPQLEVVIRHNVIAGNAEDGIQIIDYPGHTNRRIVIERNLLARNTMAGIGFMSHANTREDYEAASIPERVEVCDNMFLDNSYGISAGGNLQLRNNVFSQHGKAAVRTPLMMDGVVDQNLFWSNRTRVELAD